MSKLSSKFKLTVQKEAASEPSPSKKPAKAKAEKKQAKEEG